MKIVFTETFTLKCSRAPGYDVPFGRTCWKSVFKIYFLVSFWHRRAYMPFRGIKCDMLPFRLFHPLSESQLWSGLNENALWNWSTWNIECNRIRVVSAWPDNAYFSLRINWDETWVSCGQRWLKQGWAMWLKSISQYYILVFCFFVLIYCIWWSQRLILVKLVNCVQLFPLHPIKHFICIKHANMLVLSRYNIYHVHHLTLAC